jgi:hypothetical protein
MENKAMVNLTRRDKLRLVMAALVDTYEYHKRPVTAGQIYDFVSDKAHFLTVASLEKTTYGVFDWVDRISRQLKRLTLNNWAEVFTQGRVSRYSPTKLGRTMMMDVKKESIPIMNKLGRHLSLIFENPSARKLRSKKYVTPAELAILENALKR